MGASPDKGKEPLVYIARAQNEVVASLWKEVLEDNGIHPLLKSINLVTSLYVSPANIQYEIHVLESDADKAREILTPFLEEDA
jgi:hypothetical protein